MGNIAGLSAFQSAEGSIFAGSLVGLVLLFSLIAFERRRGAPIARGAQDAAGRAILQGLDRSIVLVHKARWSAEHVPKHLFAKAVHALASIALSLVRVLERLLKRVIDAVRGKRELRLGTPPSSSFFTEILPRHRRNFHPQERSEREQ